MKKFLLFTAALLLLPLVASAQTWTFEGPFPESADFHFSSVHGIAVDPDGKVWIQPFGATDSVNVNGTWTASRAIYIVNPDGTPADFSPLTIIEYPGGDADTLFALSGRGLGTDANGNIVIAQTGVLFRVDYQTGAGINTVAPGIGSLAEPTTDDLNVTYIAPVVPGGPIQMYDENMGFVGNAVDATVGFSRDLQISKDGLKLFWGGYTNSSIILYERADEFSLFDSVGVVIPGMDAESFDIHPVTGDLWVSAGSPNDVPNDFRDVITDWKSNTWYAFDIDELAVDQVPTPKSSFSWGTCVTFDPGGVCQENAGRPRAIDFSPDGKTVYVAQFSEAAPSVQKFVASDDTGIERVGDDVPTAFALQQNYPNPFNPSTQISFDLNRTGHAALRVYDVLGREVAVLVDEQMAPGAYTATFDASGLASGTYLYVLSVDGSRTSRTMMLMK